MQMPHCSCENHCLAYHHPNPCLMLTWHTSYLSSNFFYLNFRFPCTPSWSLPFYLYCIYSHPFLQLELFLLPFHLYQRSSFHPRYLYSAVSWEGIWVSSPRLGQAAIAAFPARPQPSSASTSLLSACEFHLWLNLGGVATLLLDWLPLHPPEKCMYFNVPMCYLLATY